MTPTPFKCFWTYTLITAMTPGRRTNILALSSATSHGFRQKYPRAGRDESGIAVVMLLCAGSISFSLAVIDPAAVHLLAGWAGRHILSGCRGKSPPAQQGEDGLQAKPISFWASFALQFVNVKIILYGVTALSTFVLPQTQALSWVVGVSVLLAMTGRLAMCAGRWRGICFNDCFASMVAS
ncbi:cysteine/O-acetylserine transporter [Escherichia coli]|nr:cysteine/O-acetylserine transporter [Escherichia coli]